LNLVVFERTCVAETLLLRNLARAWQRGETEALRS